MRRQEQISPIDQYVIDYVRRLRDIKNLTQTDISSIIGVSREFIKDVESSKRRAKYNIQHINALAEYFEMSPKDFLPEKPLKFYHVAEVEDGRKKNQTKEPAKKKTALPAKKSYK